MSLIRRLAHDVYDFFTEDGSVVVGAVIAVVIVAVLSLRPPFASARDVAGPVLFVLIAALLIANLWRVAERSKQ